MDLSKLSEENQKLVQDAIRIGDLDNMSSTAALKFKNELLKRIKNPDKEYKKSIQDLVDEAVKSGTRQNKSSGRKKKGNYCCCSSHSHSEPINATDAEISVAKKLAISTYHSRDQRPAGMECVKYGCIIASCSSLLMWGSDLLKYLSHQCH